MADQIDLAGAVDLHTHVGPSPIDRRVDAVDCATEAAAAGMDAVVTKEHFLPTVYGVHYASRHLDRAAVDVDVDVGVDGSVVLNYCNGGFNPFAVRTAVQFGARVVWGPTIDARHHAERTGDLGSFLDAEAGAAYADVSGIEATDADGRLRSAVRRCLETVVDADVVIALGHLSFRETRAIAEYLDDRGHDRLVIDHPHYPVTDLEPAQQAELVSLGASLNVPYLGLSDEYGWTDAGELADAIRHVGIEHCVLSSDTGQPSTPSVPESIRALGEALVDEGLSPAEIRRMTVENPKQLLGLA
jgi:hypothetical protein